MPDYRLTAMPPLGGYKVTFDAATAEECSELAIVSLGIPRNDVDTVNGKLSAAVGTTLPAVGKVTRSGDGKTRFLGMSQDQVFVLFDETDDGPVLPAALAGIGYQTLQTDNWVKVRLSGPEARTRLARICMVDLDPTVFAADSMARTLVEQLNTVIVADGDGLLLLSPSSSAESFIEAIKGCLGQKMPSRHFE